MKRFLIIFALIVCTLTIRSQEIISRYPNRRLIIRTWNSILPLTKKYNAAVTKIDACLEARFGPHVLDISDNERRKCVAGYKAALEASLERDDAYRALITEDDHEADNEAR